MRGNLETQICNVADELAYISHDLDDSLRSGMITLKMLESISLWELLTETINWSSHYMTDLERHHMIRDLVGLQVTDMIQSTDTRLKESKANSALDIQKLSYNVISYGDDMLFRNRELKDFLFSKLYRHYRVVRIQVKAKHIITDLFTSYLSEPLIPPDHIQQFIPLRGIEWTICDYIAGMTDRYAIEEHSRLHDPDLKP